MVALAPKYMTKDVMRSLMETGIRCSGYDKLPNVKISKQNQIDNCSLQ